MEHIAEFDPTELKKLEASLKTVLPKMIQALESQVEPNSMKQDHWLRLIASFPFFAMTSNISVLDEELMGEESFSDAWELAREKMKEIPVPEGFRTLKATVIEKRGKCDAYEEGDSFEVPSPFYWPKPCSSAWLSVWPYVIGAGFGYKSWDEDPEAFMISCPAKKGLVFELRPLSP